MNANLDATPDAELVETALDASGFAWSRRETLWIVSATREMQLRAVPGGVRLESVLVEWDEDSAIDVTALAHGLRLAKQRLRFARYELAGCRARVTAFVASGNLETALRDSLGSVAAGVQLLAREAEALLLPEVARAYLEFCGGPDERPRGGESVGASWDACPEPVPATTTLIGGVRV